MDYCEPYGGYYYRDEINNITHLNITESDAPYNFSGLYDADGNLLYIYIPKQRIGFI